MDDTAGWRQGDKDAGVAASSVASGEKLPPVAGVVNDELTAGSVIWADGVTAAESVLAADGDAAWADCLVAAGKGFASFVTGWSSS